MKIIYLSGIDGCGKTTQAKLLVENLRDEGLDAEYLWFRWKPTLKRFINAFKTRRGESISNSQPDKIAIENTEQDNWLELKTKILSKVIIRKIWLTYAALDYFMAYKKKFRKITSDIIVADRYVNDFIIDQSVNLNIPPDKTSILKNNFFLRQFKYPDLNIIIDIPAFEGYIRKDDGTSLSYLEKREQYYLAMTGENTVHINGLMSIDGIEKEILATVKSLLETVRQ